MRAIEFIIENSRYIKKSEIDYIKKLYDDNWLLKDMSELTDRSIQDIGYVLDTYYPDRDKRLRYHSDEKIKTIKNLFDQKLSYQQIGDRVGENEHTIKHILDTYYPDREKQNKVAKGITPDQINNMARRWAKGDQLNVIGQSYGITHGPVHYHLKKLPNYNELKKEHLKNRKPIKRRLHPTAGTEFVRAGTMDNKKSKGPLGKHTWGVKWPRTP